MLLTLVKVAQHVGSVDSRNIFERVARTEGMNTQPSRLRLTAQVKKTIEASRARSWEKTRKELALDLANLPNDSCKRFRERFRLIGPWADDSAILQFRDQLRKFWCGDDNYQDHRRDYFRFSWLHSWLGQAGQSTYPAWVVGTWADGTHSISLNESIFPLSLARAASELSPKMAVCGNPDCPQKYFLKGRKTQRFCDRPTCAAYGQRQHKLKWWKTHKDELRPKPKGPKKRAKTNRRH